MTHHNLLADGPAPTELPVDEAVALTETTPLDAVAQQHPASSYVWARLAEEALSRGELVPGYAYARTGYHRGLDALRRAGWRGSGPVPWEHEPNRGFLRSLAALARAARSVGETDEWDRCSQFLRDSSPTAHAELLG
ncbi:DUF3151 domain-containing protein [Propionibacteriaceae bacterium Y1685]|uniref:DUF3151 domain-containing protein n=1 Tax=Microlunatus sp. Y1700 TaxID=3418487 RepID=UPI003B7F2B14